MAHNSPSLIRFLSALRHACPWRSEVPRMDQSPPPHHARHLRSGITNLRVSRSYLTFWRIEDGGGNVCRFSLLRHGMSRFVVIISF